MPGQNPAQLRPRRDRSVLNRPVPDRPVLNRALLGLVATAGVTVAAATLAAPATASANPAAGLTGDVAVGLPGFGGTGSGSAQGRVDAFGNRGFHQWLTRGDFSSLPGSAAGFGSSMALGDIDGDGDEDLVVGTPGSSGSASTGEVDIFFRTASGFAAADAIALKPPAAAADRVGAAVALTHRRNEFGPIADLWVGAPGTDVEGMADAGAIYHYTITLNGDADDDGRFDGTGDAPRPTIQLAQTLTQDVTEVGGVVEAGDRFGEVLAPATNGVVVGVPDEDVGTGARTAVDAGAVQRIRIDADTGGLLTGQIFNQNNIGMPGRAETGDRFGAAVGNEGYAVGAPGEDVGAVRDAGLVQTFTFSNALPNALVPAAPFTQDSKGVMGTVEAGDQFGAAVAVGIFDCQEVRSVAVGVPGEDIDSKVNAGTVEMFKLPWSQPPCRSRGLHQGHGLPGASEPGDRTGAALTILNGNPESEEDRHDTLVIGAPGESVGSAVHTGRGITWRERPDTVFGPPADRTGLQYGNVLGTQPS